MFFTTKEIVRWLGLTVFEIWINLIAFLIFTILLALKYDPEVEVYSDALNTYFCIILFIRMILELSVRYSMLRLTWSATFLLTTFLFKYLLCKKLLGQLSLDYSEVFAPLYILLQLIAVRACQQEG
ncbi:hypothetical protein HHI36_015528 [Cryptolaemus montrouzieri]|uniref:Transmembrane protein 203 n=1 Tax=Cryptolaemus montrouzieri TaxID=559131 RepID=A0ABD2N757_9CUCU